MATIANQRLISIRNIIIYLEIKGLGAIRAKIGPHLRCRENFLQSVFTICAFQK